MHALGTITQAAPLLVQLDTSLSAAPARRLDGYTPAEGDRVLIVVLGSSLYVLGRVV